MPSDEPDPYTVHDDALPDIDLNASTHPIRDALQLESADPVTLFHALTAVERALPHLLLCLKPILASLTSSNNEALVREHPLAEALAEREVDEESEEKEEAGRAVVDFLAIVDVGPSSLVSPSQSSVRARNIPALYRVDREGGAMDVKQECELIAGHTRYPTTNGSVLESDGSEPYDAGPSARERDTHPFRFDITPRWSHG
jgi:hypothetical protein